jgi:hypothetical protein
MNYQEIAEKNLILKIRSGSHLFGTNTPESDLDMVGVFMPTPQMVYGFAKCETVEANVKDKDEAGRNTADAVDCTFYEFRKFIKLALDNNPNILHLLFANNENIIFQSPIGKDLLSRAKLFPHKGAHHRFIAYADAQRHKMRIKPENFHALEAALAFLADKDDHSVLGEYKNDTTCLKYDGEKGHHMLVGDLHLEPSVYVKKARRMIEDRLSKATHRKVLFTKYGFDVKFASNLIHLLKEGIDLMKYGELVYPLPYAKEIVDIKQGKYTIEEILKWADELVEEARRAFEETKLPEKPMTEYIEGYMIDALKVWLYNYKRN